MEFEYNGVLLQSVEFQSIKRELVWDDSHTDALFVRWTIGLVAVYAPGGFPVATSVKELRPGKSEAELATGDGPRDARGPGLFRRLVAAANPFVLYRRLIRGEDEEPSPVSLRNNLPDDRANVAPPTVGAGRLGPSSRYGYGPIMTDVTLRNRLMTPRAKLIIRGAEANGPRDMKVNLLESPFGSYVTDPANGPHPIACDIVDGNDKSFAVFFQIETATVPCDGESERLILSHRWQTSHTHDENQYLSIVTDGELVLNGSMVNTLNLNPDLLRSQVFPQIPLGCSRHVEHCTPSADGLTYTYRVVDTDQTITFDSGDSGAIHIEIAEKLSYYQPWKVSN